MQWQMASLYANHELLAQSYWDGGAGARWVIRLPNRSEFYTEIFAGAGGLLVHGDIDVVRFAHDSSRSAWHKLTWMAHCTDIGYYVAQKARIGMGDVLTHQYDESVAREELRERAEEVGADIPALREVLLEAAEDYAEDEYSLRSFLSERDQGWDLWECSFGNVVPHRVVSAHAALNKCASLLIERYGPSGPPQCTSPVPERGAA
jgi:hypothetical protein